MATALRVDCGVEVVEARALFADEGFAEARFFYEMTHDLAGVDDGQALSPLLRPVLGGD